VTVTAEAGARSRLAAGGCRPGRRGDRRRIGVL